MLLGGGSLNGVRVMNQATVDYFTDGGLTPDQQKSYRAWVGLEGFTYSHPDAHPERNINQNEKKAYSPIRSRMLSFLKLLFRRIKCIVLLL